MTREEAIEFGNMWLQLNEDCKNSSTYTFFQMAIKALEQETVSKESYDHEYFLRKELEMKIAKLEHDENKVLDKIRAEIEALPREGCWVQFKNIERIIDKYKAEIKPQEKVRDK